MSRSVGRILTGTVGVLLLVISACAESAGTRVFSGNNDEPEVGSIQVTPSVVDMTVGSSVTLSALVTSTDGQVIRGRSVKWQATNDSVVDVSDDGTAKGIKPGKTKVIGTTGQKADTVEVTVQSSTAVARLDIDPSSLILTALNAESTLRVAAFDATGNVVANPAVRWTSAHTTVATIDSTGKVRARSLGVALLIATSLCCDAADSIMVTVQPRVHSVLVTPQSAELRVGETLTLSAVPLDSLGSVVQGKSVSWSSLAPSRATVSAAGVATTLSEGVATLRATIDGVAGDAALSISPAPVSAVASVSITPSTVSLASGASQQLSATLKDAAGNTLTGRTITWSSSNPAVASVSSAGLITGVAAGSAVITAASEGQSATSAITVTPAPVASVTVTPSALSLQTGGTQQLTVVLRDASGNTLSGRTVTWTTNNAAVATVNGSGLVSGAGAGSAVITATAEGRSGTSAVTVTLAPVASVTLNPSSVSLSVGGSQLVTATLRDGAGNILTGRSITWASSNVAIARVDAAGLVTAMGSGSATITATSEGKSAAAAVTVAQFSGGSTPDIFSDAFEMPGWTRSGAGWNQDWHIEDISIVSAPAARGGNAARFFYNAPTNADDNVALTLNGATLPDVDLIFIRGYVYLPDPGTAAKRQMQRKLIYLSGKESPTFNLVLGVYGGADANGVPSWYLPGEVNGVSYAGWTTARTSNLFNNWHYVELEVKLNTPGQSNGYVRLWVNDPNTPVVTLTNRNLRGSSTRGFNELMLGQQLQGDSNSLSEYRYWDDFAVSTRRIGPKQ